MCVASRCSTRPGIISSPRRIASISRCSAPTASSCWGRPGCGKSTLLKAIGGYLTPVEGEIRLKGEVVTRPGPDRMMVFQEFDQLLPWKTVTENVMFPLVASGRLAGAAAARQGAGRNRQW